MAIEPARFEFTPPHAEATPDSCAGRDAVASGDDPLVEDFESNSGFVRSADRRAGPWWVFGDEACVRTPVYAHADAPGGKDPSRLALHVDAYDCNSWGFGLGVPFNGRVSRCGYDAHVYDGIYFWARSGGLNVSARVMIGTRQTEPLDYGGDGSCEAAHTHGCWEQYSLPVELSSEWRQYSFKWSELRSAHGVELPRFDPRQVTTFTLSTSAEPSLVREIWLDQLSFFKREPPRSPF